MAYPYRDFNLGELKRLTNFKYKCIDNSLTSSHITRLIFNRVQKRIHSSVHPNSITLFGFCSVLFGFIATYLLDPTLLNPPNILVLINLVALVLYFIADGVDGIHARNTGRATPLGYILDHGIDSMACAFITTGLSSTMGLGLGRLFLLFLICVYTNFYFGAILHKYTGVFIFNHISGCSEGILFGILIHSIKLLSSGFFISRNRGFGIFSKAITHLHLESVLLCAILYCFLNLGLNAYPSLKKDEYISFLSSIYNIIIPLGIFSSTFLHKGILSIDQRWLLLVILSCCFTLCYIEETLSVMLKSNPDSHAFIWVNLILALCFTVISYSCDKDSHLFILALVSSTLLSIRAFSTVKNFCKRTGQNFLTTFIVQ
ncbi:ethanolaminephosphotransferase [Pancytospora epiphaga]|nr:ethanolaminephosphotransferase [Pancytospora epiphaga]